MERDELTSFLVATDVSPAFPHFDALFDAMWARNERPAAIEEAGASCTGNGEADTEGEPSGTGLIGGAAAAFRVLRSLVRLRAATRSDGL
jgi:hypothetical protein